MAKVYERINWEDLPSKNTPINAENLNKMDKAIDDLDDKIVELEESSGDGDYLEKENPVGTGSFSMNRNASNEVGDYSTAVGYNCTASGKNSYAGGEHTTAGGRNSHAEGYMTTASGAYSHAEGASTTASGASSHAEGADTIASATYSHAEGYNTTAAGKDSHAEGNYTAAKADHSHTEGWYTTASGTYQHVQGKYNVEDTKNEFAHIVGGGTSDTDRKNIHTLDWNGNAVFSGDVTNGNGVSLNGLKTLIEEETNTNDMTLAYTEAEELTELTSGEKLTVAFGKLAKAVKDLISHLADAVKHITGDERTLWNTVSNKADSNHTHNYAGSSSAGGAANSAKKLSSTRYIDGIPFDGSSNLSRLGTCATASYDTAKKVTIGAFDGEGASDAILYIQFTGTYNGGANDTHTISINDGEPLVIYYQGAVFKWETFFSNYPFCDGQIHQFRYFWSPTGSYLELITPSNRAVANNLTTTDEKIALAAPMGKQLAETDASLQEQISTLNSNLGNNLLPNGQSIFHSSPYWWSDLMDISGDVNNIMTTGMANTIDGWAHLPNSEISYLDGWGTLVCFAPGTSNNDILQLWYGMNTNGRLFSRKYRGGSWSSWTEILFNQLPSNYIPNLDTSTILDYLIKVNKNMFNLCRESKHPGLYADNWLFTHWDDLGITMDTSQPHGWQTIYDTPGSVYNRVQKNRLEAYGANGSLVIPAVIGAIGNTAYANLANLTSIEIPDTVTTIGAYAFMGCSNATISIPSSVTYIGTDAFNGVAHVYYSGSASGAPWGATAYN